MADRPKWQQFDFDDFCGDPNLLLCPLDTQGWYVHLLRAMTRCTPFGCLSVGGVEPTPIHLAKLTPYHWQTCRHHLGILKSNGVLKRGDDGIWYNSRLVEDYRRYQDSVASGKAGAEVRWGERSDSPPQCPPPMPIEKKRIEKNKNKKREYRPLPLYDDDFAEWYNGYPRKVGRVKARPCYDRIREESVPAQLLLDARDAYAQEIMTDAVENRFIKHPATFLGPDCYFQDYAEMKGWTK